MSELEFGVKKARENNLLILLDVLIVPRRRLKNLTLGAKFLPNWRIKFWVDHTFYIAQHNAIPPAKNQNAYLLRSCRFQNPTLDR